jgi:acyl carrier protein
VHDSHTSDLTRVAQHIIAKYLGVSTNKISSRVQFANLGVDSLMAVNIASALEKEMGISLNSTLLFEASTLAELGRVLAEKIDQTNTSRER